MGFPSENEAQDKFSVRRENVVTAQLTDDGTPGGVAEQTGDYSVTPGFFWAGPPAGVVWQLNILVVYISGTGLVTANSYGMINSLAIGLYTAVEDQIGTPLIPPFPVIVKSNGDYQSVGFTQDIQDTGAGINHVTFTIAYRDVFGVPLRITPGTRVVTRPADDLTGLTNHRVTIGGYRLAMLP